MKSRSTRDEEKHRERSNNWPNETPHFKHYTERSKYTETINLTGSIKFSTVLYYSSFHIRSWLNWKSMTATKDMLRKIRSYNDINFDAIQSTGVKLEAKAQVQRRERSNISPDNTSYTKHYAERFKWTVGLIIRSPIPIRAWLNQA